MFILILEIEWNLPQLLIVLDASSGENNLFGDKKTDNKNFTKFSFDIANKEAIEYYQKGKFNDKSIKIVNSKNGR